MAMATLGQLALHFADYQRSSPHCRQLIFRANLSNCSPSPCGRLSLPRTTTGTPPTHRASGSHSLTISINLPRLTCRTQTRWLGCRSQSLPLLSASRCSPVGLATRSPADRSVDLLVRRTFGGQSRTCTPPQTACHLISRVGGGDIPAHRHE